MTYTHIALAVITMLLWGFNFVFAKMVLEELPLFLMMSLRFGLVATILIPFFRKPPADMKLLALIAFVFSIPHMGGGFGGMALGLDAGMTTLVEQTSAPFLVILSALLYKESVKYRTIIGIVLSFVGTFILLQAPTSVASPLGFFFVLIGAFSWGIYSLLVKKAGGFHPLAMVGWVSLFSFFMTLPISLVTESDHLSRISEVSTEGWMALLYTVFAASMGAHSLWCYLVSKADIHKLAPTTLMVPLFGVLGGVFFLGEQISSHMIIGAIVMTVGVTIVLLRRPATVEKDLEH